MANIKVTITATDNIGRQEHITMILPEKTAERLKKAAANTYPDGQPCSELTYELGKVYDDCAMGEFRELSRSQYYRL